MCDHLYGIMTEPYEESENIYESTLEKKTEDSFTYCYKQWFHFCPDCGENLGVEPLQVKDGLITREF